MDSDLYNQSVEYEKLTQAVYQSILNGEGANNVKVEHDVSVRGRSGVEHQVDVLWKFTQAGIEHTVLIECKNYSSALTLEKVRSFFAVLHDVGNCRGVMVTKVGYQSGTAEFAKFYGINLKILREPTDADWAGRIKDIHINLIVKTALSTEDKPIKVDLMLSPVDATQQERLNALGSPVQVKYAGPDLRFLDSKGIPKTEEMRWWLPKQLKIVDKNEGGPYIQPIELDDCYLYVNEDSPRPELLKAIGINVTYFVKTMNIRNIAIHGQQLVKAILKDFESGAVEHVARK